MVDFNLRDSFYSFRRHLRFLIYRGKANSKHLNMGSFRLDADYFITTEHGCNLSANMIDFKNTSKSISHDDSHEKIKNSPVIYLRLNAIADKKELLESIFYDFNGVFLIDPMDVALTQRPSWVGPNARWAAPHILDPLQSNGLCIPLGVEELSLMRNGLVKNLDFKEEKSEFVLVGPFAATHRSRSSFHDWEDTDLIHVLQVRLNPTDYADISGRYRFVVCPRGNGIDTHRFWETLYRGSLPIVEISEWAIYFKSHGVPMVMVKNFDEILSWSEEHFISVWKEHQSIPAEIESLWPKYWIELIRNSNWEKH
jgi:hypothetical protein